MRSPGSAGRRRRRITTLRWIGAIEDIVLGRCCALCGEPLYIHRTRPSQICRKCTGGLYRVHLAYESAVCAICGRPLLSEHGTCTSCRKSEQTPAFDSHRAALEYRAGGESLIAAFKMRGHRAVVRLAADLVIETISEGTLGGHEHSTQAVCVPVPSGSRSAKRRDVQPVYLLAGEIARSRGMAVQHLLARVGKGLDQKKLGRKERTRNVAGMFAFCGSMSAVPPVVWLIDDVYTTGATVSECAKVLKEAGVKQVHVRTLAMD